jgi:hypothetical protein
LKQKLKLDPFLKSGGRRVSEKMKLQNNHHEALLAELWAGNMSTGFLQQNHA